MATRAENLQTSLDRMAARLVDCLENPKPTYSVDGESYSWESYQAFLINSMEALEKALQRADSGGAWEVRSQGVG